MPAPDKIIRRHGDELIYLLRDAIKSVEAGRYQPLIYILEQALIDAKTLRQLNMDSNIEELKKA